MALPGERFHVLAQLEHLQSKYTGTAMRHEPSRMDCESAPRHSRLSNVSSRNEHVYCRCGEREPSSNPLQSDKSHDSAVWTASREESS
ncbi:Protein moa-2 [Caenorhabditis elegans]|uniref:Protein moa-2 n=1 Tax=Caenorhabditis elegans TaxID=6239 RepID=MOA2_CAEEL|nr:Protein moa-2 [Caenorhabditis elegans]Q09215.1 RecName: Full=Protein moa-2 [Caenorhabditis elegans]CCD61474.1 Protein moa-2 [Caenorhabditis elegans]|eukprot:NP_495616.1 Protein moa-2 [Caenorhabditis elegans]